jgi:aspartate racemase
MKTIGIIGGMSWESSATYYRLINESIKLRLGPTHSAELFMYSTDFHHVAQLELEERWDELANLLILAIKRLENGGADFAIMASNTVHKVADVVQQAANIPLLHIADVTAEAIAKAGISTVGLLGTSFVMERDFYKKRFRTQGIDTLVPDHAGKNYVHDVIYNELCVGKVVPESKERVQAMILALQRAGAQAVVLACTELPLLIRVEETPITLFDTMALHVDKAVTLALDT